jgi:hypothetical protein
MWFEIHPCMEAMLEISLYSYFYLKLAKCYVFLVIAYILSSIISEKKRAEQVLPRSRMVVEEVALTMYTHVSKYKNDKKKNSHLW